MYSCYKPSAKRSCSSLARVNYYLRSSQTQQRLVQLSVPANENYLTVKLDYDDVINKFANEKKRFRAQSIKNGKREDRSKIFPSGPEECQ
ncbi:hypothetical protein PR048_028339 [Dryococelus australis]|uniref:Uncharacterized protein n=1 Tax=Dryococelus australis TaxID=614101 RepID=A0ABQ9GJ21_9NEOP|nr:hypothetical protein PR048_028339 [Dryococelus australis]